MSFDAHKYADVFEKLACKIIAQEISEEILVSGVTKKTRDGGIDAIIHTKDNYVTIEAKLRKNSVSLGLKDIASSIIFYLLRLNDKHYIVTNVYLASDTIDVLNRLNATKDCELNYIDGNNTIKILNNLFDSLSGEEKKLAKILIKEFSENRKLNRKRHEFKNEYTSEKLLEPQEELCSSICKEISSEKKCIILSGKLGTGKTTIAREVEKRINNQYKTIYIDCQQYNTIESFMYQISNIQLGIDINELISEYISLTKDLENNSNIIAIENSNTLNILAQVLSRDKYNDSIKFLAQKYIDKIIDDFNSKNVCVIVDNYVAASVELDDFISSYILSSTNKLNFFIIKDIDCECNENSCLNKIIALPMNIQLFKHFEIHESNINTISDFIDLLNHNVPSICKEILYSYFGGNLLLIKMALNEMNQKNNYDASLLRPFGYEEIYESKISAYLNSDINLMKAFFVCWIMNSAVPQNAITMIQDDDLCNKLIKTGLFNQTNTSFVLANISIYNVISKIFIKYGHELYLKIYDFVHQVKKMSLSTLSQVRISFIENTENLSNLLEHAVEEFENKMEHSNIVEIRMLLYIYAHNHTNDIIQQLSSSANLLYALIDYDIYKVKFDFDLSEIVNELNFYFKNFEEFDNVKSLNQYNKRSISEARIKYALYLYFTYKRKNKFKEAYDCLKISDSYLSNCDDTVLISKIIRFRANCQKEMGDRNEFFNTLLNGVRNFPNNKYLTAVYNANLAANINLEKANESFNIINNIALSAAEASDKYLHLWLMNDKLIYGIQAKLLDENQVLKLHASITNRAEHLCSITDKARAYNTLGAFYIQAYDNYEAACACFKNALFLMSKHEHNNIMIYFAVNYLQFISKDEQEEFNNVCDLIFDWCKNNKEYIINKIKDSYVLPQNNKQILTLYSYMDILEKRKDHRYKMLLEIAEISDVIKNRISMNPSFYIKGIPIILF